jgi:hypothetical protein
MGKATKGKVRWAKQETKKKHAPAKTAGSKAQPKQKRPSKEEAEEENEANDGEDDDEEIVVVKKPKQKDGESVSK